MSCARKSSSPCPRSLTRGLLTRGLPTRGLLTRGRMQYTNGSETQHARPSTDPGDPRGGSRSLRARIRRVLHNGARRRAGGRAASPTAPHPGLVAAYARGGHYGGSEARLGPIRARAVLGHCRDTARGLHPIHRVHAPHGQGAGGCGRGREAGPWRGPAAVAGTGRGAARGADPTAEADFRARSDGTHVMCSEVVPADSLSG
jgi:hypothetical protein